MNPTPTHRPADTTAHRPARLHRTHHPARGLLVLALAVPLLLGGCAAVVAQNPGSTLKPVNAVAADDTARLMLKGHDVVAYFTEGRARLGSPAFRSDHQGVTFHFASADHKARFDANPVAYLPQYNGYCSSGIAYGIPWGGDADSWNIVDGRLYIYGGAGSKAAFDLDPAGNRRLADHYWATEVAGRNSFLQRAYRLTVRVPHYKSGAELADEVARARSRQP